MELTLLERAAVVRELAWTGDAVDLGESLPGKAWAASLAVVLSDILGERTCIVLGPLTHWCEVQPEPARAAVQLAQVAIYAEKGVALEALLDFAAFGG